MAKDEMKPAESYRLDTQIGFLLRLANQRHATIFQGIAPNGLTPTQFSAFVRLAEMGQCSQNELGRRTAMDVATIKGVVERLKKKGLVDLNSDPNDKRRTLLSIPQDKGEMLPVLQDAGNNISRATLAPLTGAEQKTLLRLLKKLA